MCGPLVSFRRLTVRAAALSLLVMAAPTELVAQPQSIAAMPDICLDYGARGEGLGEELVPDRNTVLDCIRMLIQKVDSLGSDADSVQLTGSAQLSGRTLSAAEYLNEARRDSRFFRRWLRQVESSVPDRLAGERLTEVVSRQLEQRGLTAPFSAILVSGPVVGLTETTDMALSEDNADKRAFAQIVWESRHFGGDGWIDGSVGGTLGLQPVMGLVAPVEQADGADPATDVPAEPPSAHFQNAFQWDLRLRMNVHHPSQDDRGEFSVGGKAGQTVLFSEATLAQTAGRPFVATPLENGASRSAWFFELGAEYNRFGTAIDRLHDAGGLLSPLAHVSAGLGWNSRFKGEGALSEFDEPELRYYFRFLIDALNLRDLRAGQEEEKTFTIGFGVEYERGWSNQVPGTTRIFFRGDLDLLNALGGGS